MSKILSFLFVLFLLNTASYSQGFKKVPSSQSNIFFSNKITESELINGITYPYLYNGGGVAVGDINNDGLEDIYFTGNQVEDRLYLNKGGLVFKDVSEKFFGKERKNSFSTGVAMVDINSDGWMDIYVSCAGPSEFANDKKNLLYINNSGKGFTEEAEKYGLNDSLNSSQAIFFDFDLDGDLDVYVLNHSYLRSVLQSNYSNKKPQKIIGEDHFYINDDGVYHEVSKNIGISSNGFGLGITILDVNCDRYPDVYITNDYNEPDKIFVNNKDGTFTDAVKYLTQHISIFAMGVDAADINNDGLTDLMTVDMASEDHVRSKKNMGGMSTKNFWNLVESGNHYQYMFNSLQLNLGNGKFTEIAQMSGVSKTDWSWAPLFADFDNDGFKDLFVSNGFYRDVRDNDFSKFYLKEIKNSSKKWDYKDVLNLIPSVKIANYIYRNNGDLTFTKKTFEWGLGEEVNVNGAVYADLDNDGDLDLVYNVIDTTSFVMENTGSTSKNYIDIKLIGMPENYNCIGAKVQVKHGENSQFREVYTVKGFQSSVSTRIHFGLGNDSKIDFIKIEWNNKEYSIVENIDANQKISIDYNKVDKKNIHNNENIDVYFLESEIKGLSQYLHEELDNNDFMNEVLLPHKMSELGPFVEVQDINNDGKEDVFVGGSRGYISSLYFQKDDGSFELQNNPSLLNDKNYEDMQSVFFDFDNDGDKDLYIVSGSNESNKNHPSLSDRLYVNDNGVFKKCDSIIPDSKVSGQKVIARDLDNDGWVDLIVFGRQVPGAYPTTPRSQVLINKKGVFTDKTSEIIPELEYIGMVTDAIFTDYDSDGDLDLICVGEWMPITVFNNEKHSYTDVTSELELEGTVGWWSAIKEVGSKGEKKYILGNISKNNKYHPSTKKPLQIYMNDFDENGTNDIVLAKYQNNVCYPVRGRQCSSEQMPFIIDKFPTYDQYASANLTSIYPKEMLDESVHFNATNFENSVLSIKNGKGIVEELPNELQTGCINSILEKDVNHDGIMDYVMLGNKYEAEVETIRYDGNLGYLVLGKKDGGFDVIPNHQSGLYLNINTKSAKFIKIKGIDYLLVASTRGGFTILKVT